MQKFKLSLVFAIVVFALAAVGALASAPAVRKVTVAPTLLSVPFWQLLERSGFRLVEVPATMRERQHGTSHINALRSVYYAFKVTLALFVGMFRRGVVPLEE